MLAYMNELEEWCVSDYIKRGEVEDYVATAIAGATVKPLSQIGIGEWISNALVVKWPCSNMIEMRCDRSRTDQAAE